MVQHRIVADISFYYQPSILMVQGWRGVHNWEREEGGGVVKAEHKFEGRPLQRVNIQMGLRDEKWIFFIDFYK